MSTAAICVVSFGVASCGTDYPPVNQNFSFNINRAITFSLPQSVQTGKDTALVTAASIDTMIYDTNGTTTALLQSAQVWRLTLTSSSESYPLQNLGSIRVLIGSDTVAFDLAPTGSQDTTLTLTKKDITTFMQDTSFTATLLCAPTSAPPSNVSIACNLTVIYTALYPL